MTVQTRASSAAVLAEPDLRKDDLVSALVDMLQPRLADSFGVDLPARIRAALDELGEVRVTTYLPILIERRFRDGHYARAPHL